MLTDAMERTAAEGEPTPRRGVSRGSASRPSAPASKVVVDRELRDLVGGSLDALRIKPPAWAMSVLGSPVSWLPAHRSEYGLLYSWRVLRTAKYIADVAIPSLPMTAPSWFPEPVAPLFWHPSSVAQHPDHDASWTTHPHEAWLFINGIMTNAAIAEMNGAYLAELFHRPITLIENSTEGLLEDLVECAREKSFGRISEATDTAFPAIYDALKDPDKQRVVVIAHSQGTIIAAAVLRFMQLVYRSGQRRPTILSDPKTACATARDAGMKLDPTDFQPLDRNELSKLELYCFANCATQMHYVDATAGRELPWIESYGNEFDIVARLGMLAPHADERDISIDGPCYRHDGAWGHLLNRHYLRAIDRSQRSGHKHGPTHGGAAPYVLLNPEDFPDERQPKIYNYINGGSPLRGS